VVNTSSVSIHAQSVGLGIVNCDDGLLFGVTHQTAGFSITTVAGDNDGNGSYEQFFRSSPLNVTTPASLTSGFLVFAVRHWWLTLFCAIPVLIMLLIDCRSRRRLNDTLSNPEAPDPA
jgi:hypothetical protein